MRYRRLCITLQHTHTYCNIGIVEDLSARESLNISHLNENKIMKNHVLRNKIARSLLCDFRLPKTLLRTHANRIEIFFKHYIEGPSISHPSFSESDPGSASDSTQSIRRITNVYNDI